MSLFLKSPAEGLLLAGVILLVWISLRQWYRRHGKRGRARAARRDAQPAAKTAEYSTPLLDAPPEVGRWQVEMHELARELKAELDSKIRVLQLLCVQARQEAERLERAVQAAAASTASVEDGEGRTAAEHRGAGKGQDDCPPSRP